MLPEKVSVELLPKVLVDAKLVDCSTLAELVDINVAAFKLESSRPAKTGLAVVAMLCDKDELSVRV